VTVSLFDQRFFRKRKLCYTEAEWAKECRHITYSFAGNKVGFGDFKIGRQIIHTVKYADDLVLLAKEEKVLQDMIDKITEIGRSYGMEMNVEKTEEMRISRQPFTVKLMIDQKQLENMEYFKYLGSMLTNDGRFISEIKSRISTAEAAFNKEAGSSY